MLGDIDVNAHNTVSLKEYTDLRINDTVTASNQRFDAQQLALKDALISQEKAVAAALDSTKEAIGKAEIATDKRFDLLSEKIDGVHETITKNVGAQGVYVTHTDLTAALDKLQTSIEITLRPVVTFMNSQTGKDIGASNKSSSIIQGIIVGSIILGIFGTVITLIIKFI